MKAELKNESKGRAKFNLEKLNPNITTKKELLAESGGDSLHY